MSQVDFSDLLSSPLFKGMAAKEIEYLSTIFSATQVQKGKTVFVENMAGESLYLIKQGAVQVSQMLAEVDEQRLTLLKNGDVFGEMAIIDGGTRSATARVTQNSVLYSLSQKDFMTLSREQPRLGLQLVLNISRIFSSRIRQAKKDYHTMLKASLER